jgi:hypothetical protein
VWPAFHSSKLALPSLCRRYRIELHDTLSGHFFLGRLVFYNIHPCSASCIREACTGISSVSPIVGLQHSPLAAPHAGQAIFKIAR